MKKILSIALVLTSLLLLASCDESKGILKEKGLENVTISQYVDDELNYTIKKNGYEYNYTIDDETKGYRDFGTTTYLYQEKTKTSTVDGETITTTYVSSSTASDYDFSEKIDALLSITKDDVEKKDGVYSFKVLKDNELLVPFTDGDIYIDNEKTTKLGSAYGTGLLSFVSATLEVEKGKAKELKLTTFYSNKTTVISYKFDNYGTTETNVLKEDSSQYTYNEYLGTDTAVITLNYEGIGEVEVTLFDTAKADKNAIDYLVYLFKKGNYKKATVDSYSSSAVFFADTTKKKGLKKSIEIPEEPTVSNTKGTLALVFVDDDSLYTAQLVLNLSDNSSSYDDEVYVPVAGVTSGFEVLDQLAVMTEDEVNGIKVKISIEYNNFTYAKPNLKE